MYIPKILNKMKIYFYRNEKYLPAIHILFKKTLHPPPELTYPPWHWACSSIRVLPLIMALANVSLPTREIGCCLFSWSQYQHRHHNIVRQTGQL